MEKKKVIITDSDGVLVNWNTAFTQFMESKGFPQVPNTDDTYNLAVRHRISPMEVHYFIKEFNEGPLIECLEPFADSVKYIKKLSEEGFRFIVVTSISNAPSAKYYRSRNLKGIFGDIFDEIHCIAQGESKEAILTENWKNTDYFWVEDHINQAESGHRAGLKTVLIRHPYNNFYKTDLFPMVSHEKPWEEIYEMVKQDYNLDSSEDI